MRRFFIWSALAAVIGLVLAGAAYWAYWTYSLVRASRPSR